MVLVRFGKWEELIDMPFADDQGLFPGTFTLLELPRESHMALKGRSILPHGIGKSLNVFELVLEQKIG